MTTNLASAANSVVSQAASALSPIASRSGLPEWVDTAILGGTADTAAYFDAAQEASRLSPQQKAGLPSLIQSVAARLEGPGSEAAGHFADALLKIALRVQPGISENAGHAWAASLIESFSKTPTDLLASAIEAARFQQFQFLNEVGPFVAREFDEPLRTRKAKMTRLRELEAAANRPKPLAAPRVDISDAEHEENLRRLRTPTTEAPSRGTTAADRAAWKAGNSALDHKALDQKNVDQVNYVRALRGEAPLSREEWVAQTNAEAAAWVARSRAARLGEGQPIAPKRKAAGV